MNGEGKVKNAQAPAAQPVEAAVEPWLSWEEAAEICRAAREWKKAQKHLDFLPLSSVHWDAALAYEETCRREYLALLAEARQQGRKATMEQCVWWTLEAKRKPGRYFGM